MQVDDSDVTVSAQKWPQKAADLSNKAWKKQVVHPVFLIKGKPDGPHILAPFAEK